MVNPKIQPTNGANAPFVGQDIGISHPHGLTYAHVTRTRTRAYALRARVRAYARTRTYVRAHILALNVGFAHIKR